MSFILDALKKSENERQRQIGPSLADVPAGRRRNDKPWWVVAVAALLVVNLGVLIVVLMRDGDAKPVADQQPAAAAAPTPTASAPVQQTYTQQYAGTQIPVTPEAQAAGSTQPAAAGTSSPAVRSLADEAGAYDSAEGSNTQNPTLAAAAVVPEGPPMVRPIEAPAVVPSPLRPSIVAQGSAGSAGEVLPTMNEILAGGARLPDLHLDIHVNSPNPSERFVFVNMRKYTEGQKLNEGPSIEKITAEGVVLNHEGLRFLLPRQ